MSSLQLFDSLVNVQWLYHHINHPDLVLLNATIKKVTSDGQRNPKWQDTQLPGARFFDLEHVFSDLNNPLPHTMLSEDDFGAAMRQLGINKDSRVIVYDNIGFYSAPRVWWMLRSMGHNQVAVLDGGAPAWNKAGYEFTTNDLKTNVKGNLLLSIMKNISVIY